MNFVCPTCHEEPVLFDGDDCPGCCKVCKQIDKDCVAVAMDDRKVDAGIRKLLEHFNTFHRRVSKSHVGNGAPQGAFAFTLTAAPTDGLSSDDLIKAAQKLMNQKSCPVVRYVWYLEHGNEETKEHPHIHGMYETHTQGRIEQKHFKRAWPIWNEKQRLGLGFRGGYHRPVRHDENYSQYIAKQHGIGETYGIE